ncbi:CpaE family protein [Chloroflexota bacterium]
MAEFVSGQSLRILMVSALEEARDELEDALAGWSGDHELFWVTQPELASRRAEDVMPDVVLVDDTLGGASVKSLIRELATRVPSAAVLVLVQAEAIGQARQAVLAGARGFLTKPLEPIDLVATLREALAPRRAGPAVLETAESARGRIIVFCAPKGGTGRTTLAINTALSLRVATKQPVVLVDADYAAPALDVALNLNAERDVADLLPRLSQLDEDLVSGVLAAHVSGMKILLAPPPGDMSAPISLPHVQHIMVVLRRMFPWVVVDLGLPLREMAYGFLDSADRIILSVLPEMVGLRNTRLMLDRLRDRGYPSEKVWLVLNRATMRGGVRPRDIEERMRMPLTLSIPDDQPLATHSINRGVPLVLSHRRSAVARAVRKLAQGLIDDLEVEDEKVPNAPARRWLPGSRSASN